MNTGKNMNCNMYNVHEHGIKQDEIKHHDGQHLEDLNGVALLQTEACGSVCSGDTLTVECEPDALGK